MSLVPFAPAPASSGARPAMLPGCGAVPCSPTPGALPPATATASLRGGAAVHPGGMAKGSQAFASVLDAVQREASPDSAAASMDAPSGERPAAGEGRPEVVDTDHGDSPLATSTVVAESPAPMSTPASSWLLLALEHGTLTRTDPMASPLEAPVGADTAALAAASATSPAAPVVEATTPAPACPVADLSRHGPTEPSPVVPPAPATALPACSLPDPAGPKTAPMPRAAAASAPQTLAGTPSAGAVLPWSRWTAAVPDSTAPAAAAAGHGEQAVADSAPVVLQTPLATPDDAAPALPTADVADVPRRLEGMESQAVRWRSDVGALTTAPPRAVAGDSAERVGPAPSGSAAGWRALDVPHVNDGPAAAINPAVLNATPVEDMAAASATMPPTRPSELLWRLAQAPGPVPPLSLDGGAMSPVIVPVGPSPDAGQGMSHLAAPSQAAAVPLPAVVGEQVTSQIVSSLKLQWRDGIGEAKLHLRPDALGQVSLTLRVEQGAVTAVVRAESTQVQEWVLQHQQLLRQQLHDAGLRLDELSVNPDGEQAHQGSHQDAPDDSPERRPRRRASREHSGLHFDQLL